MEMGDPQKAVDLIAPQVETWSFPGDRADGYLLLVGAEFRLRKPEAAIPFAKKLIEYEPTAFHYLLLAQAYDSSKRPMDAFAAYQKVLELNEADNRIDYDLVRERIEELRTVPGNPGL
jgi:tetratricopeptide (TPR) repeat protein